MQNIHINVIVRLPRRRRGNSQGEERFLATTADKQTHSHDTDYSNHPYIYIYIRMGKTLVKTI